MAPLFSAGPDFFKESPPPCGWIPQAKETPNSLLNKHGTKVMSMKTISSLKRKMAAFTTDESGATIIEYALLAALIGVALVVGVKALRTKVSGTLNNVGNAF
jgi:pilus assembly protein Flp/PilA